MNEWKKHPDNPILGPGYCILAIFDVCVVPERGKLRMWFSWRDLHSIGYTESKDGVHWTAPRIVLEVTPNIQWTRVYSNYITKNTYFPSAVPPEKVSPSLEWEKDGINRPHVLHVGNTWYMWYTGRNRDRGRTAIGLATSEDGIHWVRMGTNPVLEPCEEWEKSCVGCPHVLYEGSKFRLWYSGGDMYEPDAIGYAESEDGIHWERELTNPILRPADGWEADKVTAACIVPREKDYLAFYIGFAEGFEKSQIGIARSKDGIHNWERYSKNPVIGPGPKGSWDDCNIYKPYVVYFRNQWYLWYNASRFSDRREQIGLATISNIDF